MNRWAIFGRPYGTFLMAERGLCLREYTDTDTVVDRFKDLTARAQK
jgi:hypothetical protein